jgi:hypothetical protein
MSPKVNVSTFIDILSLLLASCLTERLPLPSLGILLLLGMFFLPVPVLSAGSLLVLFGLLFLVRDGGGSGSFRCHLSLLLEASAATHFSSAFRCHPFPSPRLSLLLEKRLHLLLLLYPHQLPLLLLLHLYLLGVPPLPAPVSSIILL